MNSLRAMMTLARLDLRLLASDRTSVFWMLVFPVLLMWLFGKTFGGAGNDAGPPPVEMAVAMQDSGALGPLFVEAIRGEGVTVKSLATDSAEAAGDLRVLTIPPGFSRQVLSRQPLALRFPAPSGGREELDRAADVQVFKGIVRFTGNMVVLEKEAGAEAARVPDLASRYREIASRPDRIVVKSETAGRGRPVPSGFAQSVPGTLTMSILMMTIIYGAVFLTFERTSGMLRRQGTLPVSRPTLIAGKMMGRFAIAGVQVIILFAAAKLLFRVDLGRSPAGLILLSTAYMIAAAAFGLLFGTIYRSPEQAGATGWIAPLIMAALGGCWWPLEVVPGWMRTAGHLFPTAWAMDGFHRLISFGDGVSAVILPSAVLIVYGVVIAAIAVRLLRWD